MANQKLSQVQIDGVEYDIGLKSLELGTGLNGNKNIQQVADGVANGLPFQGENTNAENINAALKETQPYGAVGDFSAAFGGKSSAQGTRSFTNGTNTIALGDDAHAEGNKSVALGEQSHAEGWQTVAVGAAAHSEGWETVAEGGCSHAEGINTHAEGYGSHAEGYDTHARGAFSSAAGICTVATADAQSVVGQYNVEDSNALFIVGGGTVDNQPSNALSVYRTHSKVGKALSGDQPCLRNIRFGTRSPEVANEIGFVEDKTAEYSAVTCYYEDRPLEGFGFYGGCYNIFYKKPLTECPDLIVIEVEGNSDNILWPIIDQTTTQNANPGPRLFISSASELAEYRNITITTSNTVIPTPASQATDPAYFGFGTSALSVKNNKIYINIPQLMEDMNQVGLNTNHYKYLYLQFCDSDTHAPAKEPHTLGSPLVVEEGELYLQIEK